MVMETTSVIVEGMWSMTQPDEGNTVTIQFYGRDDVYAYPYDLCCDQTTGDCDTECENDINLESQTFAVIGGS